MRLLMRREDGSFCFTTYLTNGIPPYAILSHTWGDGGQEVTFKDITKGEGAEKIGYKKLQFCAEQAVADGLHHFWVDTCCIDKSNSSELSESIISMFHWYQRATKCYVYLADVPKNDHRGVRVAAGPWGTTWKQDFQSSKWFTRGWTLQELLAPSSVEFFSSNGTRLGDKRSLEPLVHNITKIPISALQGSPLCEFSTLERMSWSTSRNTTREEDSAYCLFGIFEVQMPPLYGEGQENAMSRLKFEIERRSGMASNPLMRRQSVNRISHGGSAYLQTLPFMDEGRLRPEQRQNLVENLAFDQIDARLSDLRPPKPKTCAWIFDTQEYKDWKNETKLQDHHGFFWIKGKPGTGKSIMMKFLFMNTKKTILNATVVSFFLNARGERLERSTEGLYRSLIFQLFNHNPRLQSCMDELGFNLDRTFKTHGWQLQVLKDIFSRVVEKMGSQPLICYIDALDECPEDEIRNMIYFFEELGDQSAEVNGRLYICFSSRHYPHITIKRGVILILEQNKQHTSDISRYIDLELRINNDQDAAEIREKVIAKASGVFLWVALVIPMLNKAHDKARHGSKLTALQRKLDELPDRLSDLFRDILFRDSEDRDELLICLQWVLFAKAPMRLEELYIAVQADPRRQDAFFLDRLRIDEHSMQLRIVNVSKGLVERTKSEKPTMQFIHESVRDFLVLDQGLRVLWPELKDSFEAGSHSRLAARCLEQLGARIENQVWIPETLPDRTEAFRKLRKSVMRDFPFLEYAVENVLHHANASQALGVAQSTFLQQFPLDRWRRLHNVLAKHRVLRHPADTGLLYVLAELDLVHLMRVHTDRTKHDLVIGGRFRFPILAAVASKCSEAIRDLGFQVYEELGFKMTMTEQEEKFIRNPYLTYRTQFDTRKTVVSTYPLALHLASMGLFSPLRILLLGSGGDLNTPDVAGRTVFSLLVDQDQSDLVELLLRMQLCNPNLGDINGRTPLIYAVRSGKLSMVRLLLRNDTVDPNICDKFGRSPLSYAAEHGFVSTTRVLLDTKKAFVSSSDKNDRTALDYAKSRNSPVLVALLKEAQDAEIANDNKT